MDIDIFVRGFAIVLVLYWRFYWFIKSRVANKKNPPKILFTPRILFEKIGVILFIVIPVLQLLGWSILPWFHNDFIEILGLILIGIGVGIAISARKVLDTNWAHASDFQIKKGHSLITSGPYKYIRHPIYTGLICAQFGVQYIVGSYVIFIIPLITIIGCLVSAIREEKILSDHFGLNYQQYKKHSYMFIPYII
ncbi:MAG: isoprenylcysteine carboxylmethyltransferase family protein [Candidatus Roizmanbacteria bacterium]